ncbi:hypothetical protein EVJ58_g7790 [Rhodofomes roseus]|uniref:Uncharacterized protein n=1 Tax=Rhodofomes roseus TaxID=34475 RepID=A0A4Y9Y5T3_9APHY|nr:hypothetical protein EVJ58_g7790 [Rhodofomes roseus]
MNSYNSTSKATELARFKDFFARLRSGDFDALAKEMPPSPTKSRSTISDLTSPRSSMSSDESAWPTTPETRHRALSMIGNSGSVAIAGEDHEFTFEHATHGFESLEEMRRLAAEEVAASQKRFQPLPLDLRSRKMSIAVSESEEEVRVPRSPKKPRVAAQSNGREGKDATYETTGASDDPFARIPPSRPRGAQEIPHTRQESVQESDEDDTEDVRPPLLISEVLALNFLREIQERSQLYSPNRDADFSGLRPPTMFPAPRPTFGVGETRESIATLQDRPMKRRLHDWTLDLDL